MKPSKDIRNIRFLALLPLSASLTLAWLYVLPLPLYDYWDVLHSSYALVGTSVLRHLAFYWEPFVDQKMFFPKLLIDVLTQTTGNRHYGLEIFLGWLCQAISLRLLWNFIDRSDTISPRKKNGVAVVGAFLLFWPLLQERFQNHWYSTQYALVVTPGLLAIDLLQRFWGRWKGLAWAGAACAVAALSHGTGAVLPIALGVALLVGSGWSSAQRVVWWLGTMAGVAALAAGMPSQASLGHPPITAALASPVLLLTYAVKCVAPPLGHQWRFSLGIASILLNAEFLRIAVQKKIRETGAFAWLSLILWCGGVTAASALTRAVLEGDVKTIYYDFFVLFSASAAYSFAFLSEVPGHPCQRLAGNQASRTILLVLVGFVYFAGSVLGVQLAAGRKKMAGRVECLLGYAPLLSDENVRALFPWPRFRREILPDLAKAGAFAGILDETPFTRQERTRFAISVGPNVQTPRIDPEGFEFRIASQALFQFAPASPLSRSEAVSLDIRTDSNYRAYYSIGGESQDSSSGHPLTRSDNGMSWIFLCPDRKLFADKQSVKLAIIPSVPPGGFLNGSMRLGVWKR